MPAAAAPAGVRRYGGHDARNDRRRDETGRDDATHSFHLKLLPKTPALHVVGARAIATPKMRAVGELDGRAPPG